MLCVRHSHNSFVQHMGTAHCALRDLNVWGTVAGKTVRLWDRKSLGTTCSYLTPLAACQALFPSVSTSNLHTPNPFPPHYRRQAGPCTPGSPQVPSHSWDLEASPLSGPWGGGSPSPGPPLPAPPCRRRRPRPALPGSAAPRPAAAAAAIAMREAAGTGGGTGGPRVPPGKGTELGPAVCPPPRPPSPSFPGTERGSRCKAACRELFFFFFKNPQCLIIYAVA